MPAKRTIDGFTKADSPFVKINTALVRTLAEANAAGTAFGRVLQGTPLGKLASGLYRPSGNTKVTLGQSSTVIKVDDAAPFFVGDTIDYVSAGARGAVIFNANAVPETISLSGKLKDGLAHSVQLINPSAVSQSLRVEATVAAGVYTIKVYLATDGGGALTSKPADVIAALNSHFGHLLTATNSANTTACAAVSATPLAGGIAEGALLLDGVALTGVDKTSAQNTVTTGTSVASVAGDVVRNDDGGQNAIGLLDDDANTYTGVIDATNAPVTNAPSIGVVIDAVVDESMLQVALSDAQKTALSGIELI